MVFEIFKTKKETNKEQGDPKSELCLSLAETQKVTAQSHDPHMRYTSHTLVKLTRTPKTLLECLLPWKLVSVPLPCSQMGGPRRFDSTVQS